MIYSGQFHAENTTSNVIASPRGGPTSFVGGPVNVGNGGQLGAAGFFHDTMMVYHELCLFESVLFCPLTAARCSDFCFGFLARQYTAFLAIRLSNLVTIDKVRRLV